MINTTNLTYTSVFSEEEMAKRLKEEVEQLRKEKLRKTTKEELQQEIDKKEEEIRQLVELVNKYRSISFWLFNTIIASILLFILL